MKKSSNKNFQFIQLTSEDISSLTSKREGEIKIGEKINDSLNFRKKYVILGINEDIGPQLNGGNKGCTTAFYSFLAKFLNVQSNSFLEGDLVEIAGYIEPENFQLDINTTGLMSELDDFVIQTLRPFVNEGLIPIIIGGGHNNAYPIIKTFYEFSKNPLAVVNLDAHADFRKTDFRHSGNPFSFAHNEKMLSKYALLGLHQSYNNSYLIEKIKKNGFFHTWYDDYIYENKSITTDFELVINYFEKSPYGIELDLDAVSYVPSSASTSSGISVTEARQFVSFFAKNTNVKYLHLPEAAPQSKEEKHYVGKLLCYLVCDFIKNNLKKEKI